MNSIILDDVKKVVGVHELNDDFDTDIIMHTNTALFTLNQMGIGVEGFRINQGNETWEDFLTEQQVNLDAVKSWVGLKVKMIFDPPTSSLLAEAYKANLSELEWRIYITENYVGEI